MSEAHKGEKSCHYGKSLLPETKEKISKALSGEKSLKAKLTWKKVEEIREKYLAGGYTHITLGIEYGVGPTAIFKIVNNKSWKR